MHVWLRAHQSLGMAKDLSSPDPVCFANTIYQHVLNVFAQDQMRTNFSHSFSHKFSHCLSRGNPSLAIKSFIKMTIIIIIIITLVEQFSIRSLPNRDLRIVNLRIHFQFLSLISKFESLANLSQMSSIMCVKTKSVSESQTL